MSSRIVVAASGPQRVNSSVAKPVLGQDRGVQRPRVVVQAEHRGGPLADPLALEEVRVQPELSKTSASGIAVPALPAPKTTTSSTVRSSAPARGSTRPRRPVSR
jgi:hypothetical protein